MTNRAKHPICFAVGGAGFRHELASKFGLHAGIDVAASPGTVAVYFVIGNAWFRP